MDTILTGTLGRTVAWFHPGPQRRSARVEDVPSTTPATSRRALPLDLRVRQWLCAARRGHDFILGVDRRRMYLICQSCFHETPGWDLATRRPPLVK